MTGPISLGEYSPKFKNKAMVECTSYKKNLEGFVSLVLQRTQHEPRVPGLGVHARRSIKPA